MSFRFIALSVGLSMMAAFVLIPLGTAALISMGPEFFRSIEGRAGLIISAVFAEILLVAAIGVLPTVFDSLEDME